MLSINSVLHYLGNSLFVHFYSLSYLFCPSIGCYTPNNATLEIKTKITLDNMFVSRILKKR